MSATQGADGAVEPFSPPPPSRPAASAPRVSDDPLDDDGEFRGLELRPGWDERHPDLAPVMLLRPQESAVGLMDVGPVGVGLDAEGRPWLYWMFRDGTLRCIELTVGRVRRCEIEP